MNRRAVEIQIREVNADRFWSKVKKADGCWEWQGGTFAHGYGTFCVGGKGRYAHRIAYLLTHGAVDPDQTIDHLCRNRLCVNPAHLEQVSLADNIRRSANPAAKNLRKSYCVRGHEFTPENTIVRSDGGRRCRICDTAHAKVKRERKRDRTSPEDRRAASKAKRERWMASMSPDELASFREKNRLYLAEYRKRRSRGQP